MSGDALWIEGPDQVAIRSGQEGSGSLVRTLYSGISRGTERLISHGKVPKAEYQRMRAPFQEGDFPFPVKYGYCAVGRATEGAYRDRNVFALFPHQQSFRLPDDALTPLPDDLPAERAVLTANMETALNVLWDSRAAAGDRIAVIGAGVVGLLIASLAARLPGAEVTVIDTQPAREDLTRMLGCRFALPDDAPDEQDAVIHTSASSAGLAQAIAIAGTEAQITEASWHPAPVTIPLGGAFHSRRLRIVSSQVGRLPDTRNARWNYARRLRKAMELLAADDRLDELVSGETAFRELPDRWTDIINDAATLCHRIRY
ncbi:zinc-binding alcohol dehydrogenase [Paracoccus sp. 1_MG-2023]|uniref:zinc-dependent alcohol dehydrogenase n=1 Tax=unclassified Paracoccus (in: a-proteobacteria) TaxID=2688777 RepID=UPI001C09FDCF|nr:MULTISPECIES: zinc-binding alcohol dehydrogenase [unclassified Paracoccus (in: a-proteobacteria)]MBU2958465.1 zinc-binding alcohol dehydrogenase [Paracoccus sp. C2R09]MDO6668550.1 zinc-binding alcohol dehydrogenase [Paracoccus sp. 1_MG-2023]